MFAKYWKVLKIPMKILYQFTDQWNSELHNKDQYVKEQIQILCIVHSNKQ